MSENGAREHDRPYEPPRAGAGRGAVRAERARGGAAARAVEPGGEVRKSQLQPSIAVSP